MGNSVTKGIIATSGAALVSAGINQIGSDLFLGLLMIGLGLGCFLLYTYSVEKQAAEKALRDLNQALDERLKKATEEARKKAKTK